MGESTPEPKAVTLGPFAAYVLIAASCSTAIVVLAIVAGQIIGRWNNFSSDVIFALVLMVTSPAFLGVGVSYFVARTASLLGTPGVSDRLLG